MIVVKLFSIGDDVVEEIMAADLHAEETIDAINDRADRPYDSTAFWHIPDQYYDDLVHTLNRFFAEKVAQGGMLPKKGSYSRRLHGQR